MNLTCERFSVDILAALNYDETATKEDRFLNLFWCNISEVLPLCPHFLDLQKEITPKQLLDGHDLKFTLYSMPSILQDHLPKASL